LKSASKALARRASAFADAESIFRSAQADRWPKALRRLKSASKALARQASAFADAKSIFRSAQADRWPKASGGRIHSAHKPTLAGGLRAD